MYKVRFGPAGNDELFYELKYKSSVDAPRWLRENMGLSAYEISFGRGVRLGQETAMKIAEQARKYDIEITGHAPYYINLANLENFEKNYNYIRSSLEAMRWLGGRRLVVHPASQGRMDRETAIQNTEKSLKMVIDRLENEGFDDYLLCVETMGKYKQIGNVEEIARLCQISEKIIPCVDFGHVNALLQGQLQTRPQKIVEIMEYLENAIGMEKLRKLHVHWSPLAYGPAGEKYHTTLSDTDWVFPFAPLAKYILENDLRPVIISESKSIMAQDAKRLLEEFEGCQSS